VTGICGHWVRRMRPLVKGSTGQRWRTRCTRSLDRRSGDGGARREAARDRRVEPGRPGDRGDRGAAVAADMNSRYGGGVDGSVDDQPRTRKTRGSRSSTARSSDPGCQNCGWSAWSGELWPTHGALAVRWIEDNCICGEGDWFGQLIKLRPDQKRFLYRWYEYCPNCGSGTTTRPFGAPRRVTGRPSSSRRSWCWSSPGRADRGAVAEHPDRRGVVRAGGPVVLGGRDDVRRPGPGGEGSAAVRVLRGVRHRDQVRGRATGPDLPGRRGRRHQRGGCRRLFVCDELHEWGEPRGPGRPASRRSSGSRPEARRTPRGCGRQISLSTAGFDIDKSLLGEMVKLGRKVVNNPAVSRRGSCSTGAKLPTGWTTAQGTTGRRR
jgi:hypothetical protein